MKKRDSFLLLWLRLFLTTLLGGTISTFLYSMSGALLSYFGMLLVKQLGPKRISIIGISAAGGFMHNVGQLLMASFIAQSWTVMLYLPVLSVWESCQESLSGSRRIIFYDMCRHCNDSKKIMSREPNNNGARCLPKIIVTQGVFL